MKRLDDLKILVAVARHGSMSAGATALGLDQSTVSRRLQALEDDVGHPLFQDRGKRQTLSLVGQRIYESGVRIEAEMQALDRDVGAVGQDKAGTVQVHAADILSTHLLLSVAPKFLAAHPHINLRVRTNSGSTQNFRGDVVLAASNSPREEMYGRKLATATTAMYASREYLDRIGESPDKIVWLNWDDGSATPHWPQLAPEIDDADCRLRIDSVSAILEATRMGLGATFLPCFIGECDPQLIRVNPGEIVSRRDVWLLVHADVRRIARVRTFLEFMLDHVKDHKSIIESV